MRKNPLIPFALIAFIGIIMMVILSYQGLNKADQLAKAKKNGGGTAQAVSKPEDIAKNTCAACHGGSLEGGVGPKLSNIGSVLKEDEIKAILMNGKGNMPAGLVGAEEAAAMAKWLAAKK